MRGLQDRRHEPRIPDFEPAMQKQNIFGFQVVMGDSVHMKLLDSVENLGDAVEHFLFG